MHRHPGEGSWERKPNHAGFVGRIYHDLCQQYHGMQGHAKMWDIQQASHDGVWENRRVGYNDDGRPLELEKPALKARPIGAWTRLNQEDGELPEPSEKRLIDWRRENLCVQSWKRRVEPSLCGVTEYSEYHTEVELLPIFTYISIVTEMYVSTFPRHLHWSPRWQISRKFNQIAF